MEIEAMIDPNLASIAASPPAAISSAQQRRRSLMLDSVRSLIGSGARGPGSLAEAQAAAITNAKLRQAGMQVVVEPFRVHRQPLALRSAITVLAPLSAASYGLAPLTATLVLLALVLVDLALLNSTAWKSRIESQNVVGTRATSGVPGWRLVLLAPLDAPLRLSLASQILAGPGWGASIRRASALLSLVALASLGLAYGQGLWWYVQIIPATYLLLVAVAELVCRRATTSPGALSYAASLAVLLASAEQLADLHQTEIWAVALGATTVGDSGLRDFFGRYPFERERTILVGLEGVGAGRPTAITREGPFGRALADPLLLRLAAAADAADPLIDMEPRPYRAAPTCLTELLRQRWRGISIATLDMHGRVPFRHSSQDLPERIDEQVLDRTLRLVVGLARQLDAAEGDSGYG